MHLVSYFKIKNLIAEDLQHLLHLFYLKLLQKSSKN